MDALYDRFQGDRALRPLFGRDLSSQRRRQKLFFAEWLGGPPRYSESAWGALYRHHEDLPITRVLAERWLDHLRGALSDSVPGDSDAAIILERAHAVALALVNLDGPGPAGQGRGTPKHRSELIASCGVGARTLKQAALSAQRGKVEKLSTLVEEVPDVLERPAFAARVLQDATLAGRGNVVQWLIGRGVDVNRPAPLHVSLVGASFELVFFVTPLCAARMSPGRTRSRSHHAHQR